MLAVAPERHDIVLQAQDAIAERLDPAELRRRNLVPAERMPYVTPLKTRSGAIHGLERAFKELHPYKVPELLAVPVSGGLDRYLGWINDETSLTIV